MIILLENRWQATKVRWIVWLSFLWAAGWIYWAWTLAQSFGLSPGDGGVLRPPAQRYLASLIAATAGLLPLAGLILYSRLYLIRIEREQGHVILTMLGLTGARSERLALSAFAGTAAYEGRMQMRVFVDAPWMTLRVTGRKLPFIVDLQAERVDIKAIAALSGPHRPTRRERRRQQAKISR